MFKFIECRVIFLLYFTHFLMEILLIAFLILISNLNLNLNLNLIIDAALQVILLYLYLFHFPYIHLPAIFPGAQTLQIIKNVLFL